MVTLKDVIHAAYGAKDSEGTLTQTYIQTVFISSNVSISVKILKPTYPRERTISN